MGFQTSQWSDQWDHFVKGLALAWDKVEGRPYGLLSVIWDGVGGLSDWVLGNSDAGFALLLAAVVLIVGRILARQR